MRLYVGGTFDLPHAGHVSLLRRAARHGEVWVSLNTDEFAARYKRRPTMTFEERMKVVSEFRSVTAVVENIGGEDSTLAISMVRPNLIVHGDDWTGTALMEQMGLTQDFLDEHDIGLLYLPYTHGVSTSEIIERVAA